MEKLKFTTEIKASKEKVWEVLWKDENYRNWSSVFCEGSHAESDWNEGSKIYFLSPSGEGMSSIIEKKIPHEYMAFKHIGEMKDRKEVPLNDKIKEWSGAMETYTLKETIGVTELTIELDSVGEFKDFFKDTFPKAIERIKLLSES